MTYSHEKDNNIDERVIFASKSIEETENLIEEFKPFLHGCVNKFYPGVNSADHDEMYSIAMLAFYEAVKSYDLSKGHFFPFVTTVIKRRLTDNMRAIYRKKNISVSLDDYDDYDGAQNDEIEYISIEAHKKEQERQQIVSEIEQYKNELSSWGITMRSLEAQSPKQARVRALYKYAIKLIYEDKEIMKVIMEKKYFPIKRISELTNIPPKKLERARIYIIASLIILSGDYDYLQGYIDKD